MPGLAISQEISNHRKMDLLRVNDTFTLITHPEGKRTVEAKWVHTIKENSYGTKTHKARYVAKGYS